MKCAPFGLTSVTSSWNPSCLRSIGTTSFSKRLFNSVSLPLMTWNWTLRANLMTPTPLALEVGDLHRQTRDGGPDSARYRSLLGPLKEPYAITHRGAIVAFAAL